MLSERELLKIQKPAQYLGGEIGSITKSENEIDLRVCLAFPDTYEVGMSHIGFQILYDLINRNPKIWAERAYVPLADMEELLRRKGEPLRSLEAKRPLSEFDLVGFSLQYELCMTGILSILDLGGIPLKAVDRTDSDPIVIGGGPVTYHPEPFSDFFDAFLIGDGEELVPEFLGRVSELKKSGATRLEILTEITKIQGVYVPRFFEPIYSDHRNFLGFKPLLAGYESIRRQIIPTLQGAPFPENPIVPNIKAVHDRLSVEVMRGCVRGCRFCQAGYLYRPQRERSPEEILKIVENSLKNTGYEELSLLSLSTADYCSILPLLSALKDRFATEDRLAISFPSTRVDALTPELLQEVQPIRRSGFTIAPEAGTQRLRDVINKGVTQEELVETCRNVFKLGWSSIKMYFMIGLPTETDEDIYGIVDCAKKVKAIAGRRNDITVSVSTLVPKPHTPFQWAEQIGEGETRRRQEILFKELKRIGVNFRYHDAFSSFLEGVFARGDRQLSQVILRAYELGCRLDGWIEEVKADLWLKAFEDCGVDPYHYLHARNEEAALPWDHISCDIPKKYFLREWQRAIKVKTTPDCLTRSDWRETEPFGGFKPVVRRPKVELHRTGAQLESAKPSTNLADQLAPASKLCSVCGSCDYETTQNVFFDRKATEDRLGIVDPPWQPIIERRARGEIALEVLDVQPGSNPATPDRSGGYKLKEYLRTEVDSSIVEESIPGLRIRSRVRFRYSKLGLAKFFAHLELASVFFRAARRQDIPLVFSRGFNPKPRIIFGPPLQLGIESSCEFVDIFLTEEMAPDELMAKFNAALPLGLQIESATKIDLKANGVQSLVRRQSFEAQIDSAVVDDKEVALALAGIEGWQEKKIDRTRKGKTISVALTDSVEKFHYEDNRLVFTLSFDSNKPGLKPYEVLSCLTGLNENAVFVRKVGCEMALG